MLPRRELIFYRAYIRFFDFAETEMFRHAGLTFSHVFDHLMIWLPLVYLECSFYHAASLDDFLEVSTFVREFSNKSFRLNFEVRRNGEAEVIASAHFVLAAVDHNTFKSVPVPEEMRQRLAPFSQVKAK